MIIGLIGFGKVSKTLMKLIKSDDIEFVTSLENRSSKTRDSILNEDVTVLPTFRDVAITADILISANSPKSSLSVAKEYGKFVNGIFLDLNNISPNTTFEISRHVGNFVDGAIIGKIDSEDTTMYLAGVNAEKLLFLDEFLNVNVISEKIGDASILKLLRSTYTKTLSALLIESSQIAKNNNLEDEFFDVLAITEGDDFKEKSQSRINNTLNSSKRKSEELEEIIDYFDGEDLIMVKAALEKLSR